MVILHGQYNFIELYNWKSEVHSKIHSMEDVHSIVVGQSRNKMSIGVKNKAVKEKAMKELDSLNISVDAFIFYQMTPPELYPGHYQVSPTCSTRAKKSSYMYSRDHSQK